VVREGDVAGVGRPGNGRFRDTRNADCGTKCGGIPQPGLSSAISSTSARAGFAVPGRPGACPPRPAAPDEAGMPAQEGARGDDQAQLAESCEKLGSGHQPGRECVRVHHLAGQGASIDVLAHRQDEVPCGRRLQADR
jgi:hypothetical protein